MPCVYLPGPAPAVTVANSKGMPIIYIKIEILAGSLTSWTGFLILIFSIEDISVVDPDPELSSPDPTPTLCNGNFINKMYFNHSREITLISTK